MKILAIDTALGTCSVAVTSKNAVLACLSDKRLRGQAEQLIPMIEQALSDARVTYSDLDMLAVTVGPGIFTGLRIGLAAIRAIAVAANKPAVGVTTLQVLAASVMAKKVSKKPLYVAIDGRRKECFLQKFDITAGDFPQPLSEAQSVPLAEARNHFGAEPALIVGSGVELIVAQPGFASGHITPFPLDPDPDPLMIARQAEIKFKTSPPIGPPDPLYLRAPDAKLPGGKLPATS